MKKEKQKSFIYSSVDLELTKPLQSYDIDLCLCNYEKIRNGIFTELRINETQKRIKNKLLSIDNDEIELLFYKSKCVGDSSIEDSIDSLLSDVGDNNIVEDIREVEGNDEVGDNNIVENNSCVENIREIDNNIGVENGLNRDIFDGNIDNENKLNTGKFEDIKDDSVSSDTLNEDDFLEQNEVNLDYIEDEAELSGSGSSDSVVDEKEIFEDLKKSKFISTKKVKDDYFEGLSKHGEEMEVMDVEKLNKLKEKYGSKKIDFKYKKIFSKREFKDEDESGIDVSSSEDGFLYSAINEFESEISHEKVCDIEETEFAKSLDENNFMEKSLVFSNKQDVLEEMVKDKGKKNNYAFQRSKK
ncbi:hypothetical protein LUQ84_001940 [Hamiltosporidium tvaerminnensis]|nr:hypothetical protein LUQ84_001940 [Hamiltosporidium tvaerminnensis]